MEFEFSSRDVNLEGHSANPFGGGDAANWGSAQFGETGPDANLEIVIGSEASRSRHRHSGEDGGDNVVVRGRIKVNRSLEGVGTKIEDVFEVAEVGIFNIGLLLFTDKGTDVGCLVSSVALAGSEGFDERGVGWASRADIVDVLAIFAVGAAQVSFDDEVSEAPRIGLDVESNGHHLGFVSFGGEENQLTSGVISFNLVNSSSRLSEENLNILGGNGGSREDQHRSSHNSSGGDQERFSVGNDFVSIQHSHNSVFFEFAIHEFSGRLSFAGEEASQLIFDEVVIQVKFVGDGHGGAESQKHH